MKSSSAVRAKVLRLVDTNGRTDEELVQAYIQGDERAFTELFDRYRNRIINFIFMIVRDDARSEDLTQMVFIRAHRHIESFDKTKKFSTWLHTIAKNMSINELRDRSRNPIILFQVFDDAKDDKDVEDDRPLDFGTADETPDKVLERERLRKIVDDCLEELSEDHRQIFVLREVEGKDYEEISTITGFSLGTVKSKLNRARNSFMASVLMHPEW